MARNKVQFQKGLSEAGFTKLYGSEDKCRTALFAWRWPEGFVCPACGGMRYCEVAQEGRKLYQCNACHTQTSLIAGTIFASTKLPLTVWFRGMYLITQSKQGISRLELSRRLGVRYSTAWMLHHKLAQVMMERDQGKPLDGRVEMDDAYLGGERNGGKRGRGSPGKTPIRGDDTGTRPQADPREDPAREAVLEDAHRGACRWHPEARRAGTDRWPRLLQGPDGGRLHA